MEHLSEQEAFQMTLKLLNQKRFSQNFYQRKSLQQEFNLETYKYLYDTYFENTNNLSFNEIREIFYKDKVKPFYDGKNYFVDWNLSQEYYFNFVLYKILNNNFNPTSLVDIGSGTGDLARYLSKKINCRVLALDTMQYALKIINLVNKRENYNIEAIKFNFQDAKVPIPANSFILTSYSLMYLKNEAEDFFVKLLDSDPIGGIFFEPIYEDQNGISTIDKHRKSYFKNCEYSTDFYSKFLKIITRKGYGIIFHEKNVLAHNLLCPLSVIGWKRL